MRFLLVSLVFVATSVTLANSWCRSPRREISDYRQKCKDWWKTAFKSCFFYEGCVNKIREKCPDFLKVDDKFEIKYMVGIRHITWIITVRATDWKGSWVQYNKYKKTGICEGDDAGLGKCLIWWRAAVKVGRNDVVDRCMRLMEDKCSDGLTMVVNRKKDKRHKGKPATEMSLTYSYSNQNPVTFKRFIYE